jgi:enoyl-CoA hydratase/carnithine racemase
MQTPQADYFAAYRNLKLSRDDKGVLVAEFHSDGGQFIMTAQSHTEFVDAFHRIGQDRANKIVIITGAGGNFIGDVEWPSFGDVADPGVWSRIHDEGVQVLENIANIRVPVIAAVEGRAHIHSDYALLANVIVAAEGATFQDVGHFAVGVTPGDGIFTTWSYRAGPGRAEAFLLNPQPLPARTAYEWGVVAEVVANGKAVARARELADLYLRAPEVTRRNTRVHFIQPLKERIVREVGYGLSLEGASSADLVKSKRSRARLRTLYAARACMILRASEVSRAGQGVGLLGAAARIFDATSAAAPTHHPSRQENAMSDPTSRLHLKMPRLSLLTTRSASRPGFATIQQES